MFFSCFIQKTFVVAYPKYEPLISEKFATVSK